MDLKREIEELLNLEKFNNLNKDQKSMVSEAIYASSLILSKGQREKYLKLIKERLNSIECIDDDYYENGIGYGGIVKTEVASEAIDSDGNIFPFSFNLKYKEIDSPFGRLTKSILHEFSHLTCKKENVTLTGEDTKTKDGILHIDKGGLVITEGFISEYGQALTETMDEFTTFLSYKAYLKDININNRLRKFAANHGLEIEKESEYDDILYENMYSSYPEEELSHDNEYMTSMFNPLYNKYSPLTKLIMHSFQNPMFNESDLKEAYKKGEGLEAKIKGTPINDFFYGYYESTFHTEDVFNEMMGEDAWKMFCIKYDSKLLLEEIDYDFLEGSIEYFRMFYEKRVNEYLKEGIITKAQAIERLNEFIITYESCNNFYFTNLKRNSLVN